MSESVFIISGAPCQECGIKIEKQEDEPVVFFCNVHRVDHVWHAECLPEHLVHALAMAEIKRTAPYN